MDIEHLRSWIGREESGTETVSTELVRRFEATFDRVADPAPGAAAPLLIHWCLAPQVAPMSGLGPDGHPARGGFLPPVPLPRRMWAGGAIDFHAPLRVGDRVTRRSVIRDVTARQGRTGALCFVTVEHRIEAAGRALLTERQDLVYRGAPSEVATRPPAEPAPTGAITRRLTPTPTLLFRYSALTFNGHRIHYDAPYARQVEGYAGLVVHGPLLATLLCRMAAEVGGRPPARFLFRGHEPLCDDADICLHASPEGAGLRLWAARPGGPLAMAAEATWSAPDDTAADPGGTAGRVAG